MDTAIQANGITPQQPSEPPQSVKEMKFEVNPSLMSGDSSSTIITNERGEELGKETATAPVEPKIIPPKAEAQVSEKKAEATPAKKESILKAPKEEAVKPADKLVVAEQPVKIEEQVSPLGLKTVKLGDKKQEQDAFDYTGYSVSEVTNLKNMSRQSREFTANLIKERKQLEGIKDSTFLQHEEAYTLAPEFKELRGKVFQAQTEGQAWEKALIAIEACETFVQPIGRDKNGELVYSQPKQATTQDKIRIGQNLNACVTALQESNGKLNQYPQRFKQQIQQDLSAIDQVRKQSFEWQADPKMLDATVVTEQGEQKVRDIITNFTNQVPSYMRSHPAVSFAADLMVSLVIRTAELAEAQKGKGVADIKAIEAARGEPSSTAAEIGLGNKTTKNGVPKEFSLAGMPGKE